MKLLGKVSLFLGVALLSAPVAATAKMDCKAKEELILKKLKIAETHGNSGQIRGLERALVNVRTWCSERDLVRDAEKKVREKQKEVDERKEELRESMADGDKESKITKRKRKLAEAQEELAEAIAEHDALK